ncbi:stromal 70 kDa heat shock-related protein, chloroplastic-like [Castanea sativa]|uniref:stromal 70 kDa heat shock-related protein, chloroplastic-like n=1 Tax=Castanea sativa TaxID=21020 RepID=UPI003F6495D7
MASSTFAQFRITPPPPPPPPGYFGKLNLASVSSKEFFFGHKTTAFYPKLRAKSLVLSVVNENVDEIDLGTMNSVMDAELLLALNTVFGPARSRGVNQSLVRGLDVSPLSLGLETLGGVMTKIIPRNTPLPTSKSEREVAWDNRYVCGFHLDIPPAPRGVPQIEVKFCINSNGIISIIAVDKGTGEKHDIRIILPNDYMRRMVNEVERFAKDYKEKRDDIGTKNQAESVVYQIEKQLKELGEMRERDLEKKLENKLGWAPTGPTRSSTQAIKDVIATLNQEAMQPGQSLYNQPGAPSTRPRPTPGNESRPSESSGKELKGDFIDADFTESN